MTCRGRLLYTLLFFVPAEQGRVLQRLRQKQSKAMLWKPVQASEGFGGAGQAAELQGFIEGLFCCLASEERFKPHGASILSFANDVDQQPHAEHSGKQIPDDAQGRKTEQQGVDAGGDDHRGADNHGRDDDAEGHAAGHIFEGMDKSGKVFVPESQRQFIAVGLTQQALSGDSESPVAN